MNLLICNTLPYIKISSLREIVVGKGYMYERLWLHLTALHPSAALFLEHRLPLRQCKVSLHKTFLRFAFKAT